MKRLALGLILLFASASGGSLGQGSQTCPTSGAKALSSTSTRAMWVAISAPSTNTGQIFVGGPGVTTSTGSPMFASGSAFFPPASNSAQYTLSGVFIACTASADSVTFTYLQ